MLYLGIDVQVKRDLAYAVLDQNYRRHTSGWVPCADIQPALATFDRLLDDLSRTDDIVAAIDAPRLPLPAPRHYRWSGADWVPCEGRKGRHCELVVKALGLANPQWTPVAGTPIEPWMALGFALFAHLSSRHRLLEVFPSASYRMLADQPEPRIELSLATFAPGPRDMLDAYAAAITAGEFLAGRGGEVGGGDGLGTIVLPRPCTPSVPALLEWPR